MKKILITGATGNIGAELIRFLYQSDLPCRVFAGVRNIDQAKVIFSNYPKLEYLYFDFDNPAKYDEALVGIDSIFLLRPPQISAVDKYFRPLIDSILRSNINEIVFLSVQGADKNKYIPHNKIERLVQGSGLSYIFLRPSYFMQNLTTTLIEDIVSKREIVLPAGKAKFNWIDTQNIGEVAAILFDKFKDFKNQAFDITGLENANFAKVTQLINGSIRNPINFRNVSPLKFYLENRKKGISYSKIIVMIMLHFLPRFQREPGISDFYEQLTGKKPTSLLEFINREKNKFEKSSL